MPAASVNVFGIHQYDNQTSFFDPSTPVLPQSAGWAVIVGFGAFFAVFTLVLVWFDIKFAGHKIVSENFQTAGRAIKTGLISVDVVSHWTWSITLLQSSTVAYSWGIAGPFWYAAGAVLQIMLFGIMAVLIKRRAPNAHTILEVVRVRWGTAAHIVFFYFFFINNFFITSTLIIGASTVISTLTGVSVYASCLLIPLGVVIYCGLGGLKAAFISSYLHSTIIYAGVLLFSYTLYTAASASVGLGSISQVWHNLNAKALVSPVAGNRDGSYMTMFSLPGLEFGWIFFASCFGWIWADQGFWQSAIAARPSAAYKGYILGGLLWVGVPFCLATSMGLGALALDLPLSATEVAEGLVPPATAYHLYGKGGVVVIIIMIFMAVTSSGSAEFLAVSSLVGYDIYKTYINKHASGRQVLLVSRLAVLIFGLGSGIVCVAFVKGGVNINWLFFVIGLLVASVFPPISFLLCWSKVPRGAAITAALGGQFAAITAWLATTYAVHGQVTIATTAKNGPSLAGNIVAIGVSTVIVVVWTWLRPDNSCSWDDLRDRLRSNVEVLDGQKFTDYEQEDPAGMAKAYKRTWFWSVTVSVLVFVVWPLLTLPAGVFSEGYFTFWVVLSLAWGTIASIIAVVYPLLESHEVLWNVLLCRTYKGTTPSGANAPSKAAAAKDIDDSGGITVDARG